MGRSTGSSEGEQHPPTMVSDVTSDLPWSSDTSGESVDEVAGEYSGPPVFSHSKLFLFPSYLLHFSDLPSFLFQT